MTSKAPGGVKGAGGGEMKGTSQVWKGPVARKGARVVGHITTTLAFEAKIGDEKAKGSSAFKRV